MSSPARLATSCEGQSHSWPEEALISLAGGKEHCVGTGCAGGMSTAPKASAAGAHHTQLICTHLFSTMSVSPHQHVGFTRAGVSSGVQTADRTTQGRARAQFTSGELMNRFLMDF